MTPSRLTRRELLRRGAGVALAAGTWPVMASCGANGEDVAPFTGTLRVLGLPLEVNGLLAGAARRDLGFGVAPEAVSEDELVERSTRHSESFDLVSSYAHLVDRVWPQGTLTPLDRSRIQRWASVGRLYRRGVPAAAAGCTPGDGDAPFRKLYDRSAAAAEEEPSRLVGAPSTYALESFGYRADELTVAPEELSWAELLNGRRRGRIALPAAPAMGLQDAALAAEATGALEFADKGDMSRDEIDALTTVLRKLKRRGHFLSFWSTPDTPVDLLAAGEAVVACLPPSGVVLLQSAGHPVRYAAPPEGYRGLGGLFHVSASAAGDESRLRACYEYVDWWYSGVPGAVLMGFGVYNAAMEATRPLVSPDDWDYWIEGRPAATELDTPFADRSIPAGNVRDGGSLAERSCSIATWTSTFGDTWDYARERWSEVVAA